MQRARVVLGGGAPMPWRLPEVEQWRRGHALSAPVAGQAGTLAMAHPPPLAKKGHKVPLTSPAVARALLRLERERWARTTQGVKNTVSPHFAAQRTTKPSS